MGGAVSRRHLLGFVSHKAKGNGCWCRRCQCRMTGQLGTKEQENKHQTQNEVEPPKPSYFYLQLQSDITIFFRCVRAYLYKAWARDMSFWPIAFLNDTVTDEGFPERCTFDSSQPAFNATMSSDKVSTLFTTPVTAILIDDISLTSVWEGREDQISFFRFLHVVDRQLDHLLGNHIRTIPTHLKGNKLGKFSEWTRFRGTSL